MGIEFDEENNFNHSFDRRNTSSASSITNWFIKIGLAKDENSAKTIMSIVAIICFSIAIFFAIK
ncbi:MAG: hypothetical protein WCR40_01135 [Candidatus Paceibacterota bacterium]